MADSHDRFEILISTHQLAGYINNPNWLVVDCRFDLMDPDWGYQNYQKEHIQGAVYAHLDYDLSGPKSNHTGRHPLPGPDEIQGSLQKLGISDSTQVVVYDTNGGAFAARLWWLLKFYGHDRVALLDGSYQKWIDESLPTASGIETRMPGILTFNEHPEMMVTSDEVHRLTNNSSVCIIDARAPVRYRGEQEPIDPIAGHIPGAVNRFHGLNLTPDGVFLPPHQLRAQFLDIFHGSPPSQAIVYCGSGVTSCHHIIAMAYAGLPLPRLYAGSWSEWIRDPSRPVEKG